MHSGTKLFQNNVKIQWRVACIYLRTPFRSQLVSSVVPKRNMRMCPPPNALPCPAMCLPASKWFCVPRNCKVQRQDGDIHLALQLATDKGNHAFSRGSSIEQSHKVIHASHRSQIAAASQPHRRKTYRHLVDCSKRTSMQASKSRCSP